MGLMDNNKRKNLRSKKKLCYDERVIIEQYLKDKIPKWKIAKTVQWKTYKTI